MPTVKTGYWIRVENNQVKDVWDSFPTNSKADLPGWREAVEVFPDITENREAYGAHSFNLDAEPAEIVWSVIDITVDDRKENLRYLAKRAFQLVVQEELNKELDDDPDSTYDQTVVDTAQTTYQNAITAINALTTHEEVDTYEA